MNHSLIRDAKRFTPFTGLPLALLLGTIGGHPATAAGPGPAGSPWPAPVPCRIQEGTNRDVWVMTLGDVETPLAQGKFDPQRDTVVLNDGTTRTHYFRDTLGVRFYQPIDKTRFPTPPSGWCTWYFYYNRITATEVERNADWLAANLKDYGARYVQIDDGWQGSGGPDGTRDWTHVNPEHFPHGLGEVARHIKALGLKPGLWLAPHGQSLPQVVSNHPGLFLRQPDGTTASDTWEGKFLVDPTAPEARSYLSNLFAGLARDGYDYFKIDGQPIVVDEYARKKKFMHQPADDAPALYRDTLAAIRAAIGPDRYLLGCWGLPIEGAGIMNGSRTGGDIVLGWSGFQVALRATFQGYYLHNTVWYSDPDVVLVRPPLPIEQARVWATLQGLTGQAVMSSDRLMDLPASRVELLKRIFPAADVRPLDLFPVEGEKHIWDLKIHHLDRRYDVVGLFNFSEGSAKPLRVSWADLGLSATQRYHVFDFWNQEYLGAWEAGLSVTLAPTSCRVLTLVPDEDRIELVSTSRHLTQGWIDLVSLTRNADGHGFKGVSEVVGNDPYALRFAFPRGTNCVVKSVQARGSGGTLPVRIENHQGWASVIVTPRHTGRIRWEVTFGPGDVYHFPPGTPAGLAVERAGLDGVNLHWQEQYYLNCGYQVYLDGARAGYTADAVFPLRGLDWSRPHTAKVTAVWQDGMESRKPGEITFNLADLLPPRLSLMDLTPDHAAGTRGAWSEETVSAGALTFGGEQHTGVGALADSEVAYDVHGGFKTFTALVGVGPHTRDDRTLEFIVLGDGHELWRSGPMKKGDAPKPATVDVRNVQRLTLRVDGDRGGATAGYRSHDEGGWADPLLIRATPDPTPADAPAQPNP